MFRKTGIIATYHAPNDGGGGGGAANAIGGGTGDNPGGGTGDNPGGGNAAPWAGAENGPWKLGEGDAAKPWWTAIAEPDVQAHMEAKQYANPSELAMAHLNLTRLQGDADNVLKIPKDDATEAEWNEFHTKLGRPETPDKYAFDFPEGAKVDDKFLEFGKGLFHKLGLSPKNAQMAAAEWQKFSAAETTARAEAKSAADDASITALKESVGANKWDAYVADGSRAVRTLGLPDATINALEQNLSSAAVVELFVKLGKASAEGTFTGDTHVDPNNVDTMSAEQAQARLDELQGDKAYWDSYMSGDPSKVKFVTSLFTKAG